MSPSRILGIDPGLTGAIALLDRAAPLGSTTVWDMPQVHKVVDAAGLADLIREARPEVIILEEVGPQPRDGVRQAFSFGQSYATARTVGLLLEIPVYLAKPQAWKRHFHLRGGPEGKEQARALALRRFPVSPKAFGLKKHHNRAEAALLALYGAERLLPIGSPTGPNRVEGVAPAGGVAAYLAAEEQWRDLLAGLNALRRDRGMTILLIGHSTIETVNDPTTVAYSRYDIRLQKRATALFQDEMDAILFINQDVTIKADDPKSKAGASRSRADGGGNRWIYAAPRPAFVAKNRFGLPDKILCPRGQAYAELAKHLPQPARPQAAAEAA